MPLSLSCFWYLHFGGDDVPWGGGKRGGETVTLYRAVSAAELADIRATGGFPGNNALESKLFASSVEDAAAWGREFFRYDRRPFQIVEVTIPRSMVARLAWMRVDRRTVVAVDRKVLPDFNEIATVRELMSIPVGVPS